MKNRDETEKAILEAVTAIVRERGFGALGVNAVAEAAGVSKVLIYRYFGSYRGLLEEWATGRNFWIRGTVGAEAAIAAANGDRPAIAEILKGLVREQAAELRTDRVSREILRWFLAEEDAAAASVMARLEKRGAEVAEAVAAALGGGTDFAPLSAIAVAGVYYLSLLADRASVFNGVDIATDAGWTRILAALDSLIDTLVLAAPRGP